ncbi:MAG: sensor histidine kinase [Hyphomicrobiales bacterium]|nr:sensor histidine kinase [Hyphomicrobiales bacterium]MCP5373989.1 sensor histidine kinase [Hyphomicrobiales bacterium]
MKLPHKIFAFTFVIATATLAGVAVHTVDQTTRLLTDQAIATTARHTEREGAVLRDQVEGAESDALLLASLDAARGLPVAATDLARGERWAELVRAFRTVMTEKPFYAQVRLIGIADDGRELVRVDQDSRGIRAVPLDALQSKGDRYYFSEALQLGGGQVFVSKLDLNQEHGAIVEPHQPMLRLSTPVFDGAGHTVAVIVINIDVNVLLRNVIPPASDGFLVLTDCGGEILYHPDPSRTFAFEFGRHDRIQDEFGLQQDWADWMKEPARISTTLAMPTHLLSVARVDLPGAWDEKDGLRTLVVGHVVPQTAVMKAGDDLRDHLYVTLLGVCAFLGLSIGGATAWLTRPVTALTRAAGRIAAGETDVDLPITTRDEIGTLADGLRRMVRSLAEAARNKELAAMGRMAAMVAHDLRNALSSIKVNMHTLEKGCRHPSDQREQQWGLAQEQIAYMEDVLSDMLAFARPETPNQDWQDPRGIADAAAIAVSQKAAEKGVDIALGALGPLPPVWGDRSQLIRLFRNLAENAIQASDPGGMVRFEGAVAASDRGNEVVIKVIDQGDGIPAEHREHLFDPFFTTRTMGTGLGLAIVKRIVDQHGGRIDFDTRAGAGTTFTVALPTQPRTPA